jgi:hypothetical protein
LLTITCDILVVGGFVLAAVGQQATVAGSVVSSHVFWYGVLLALLVAWILPGWAAGLLFAIGLLASDLLSSLVGRARSSSSSSSSNGLFLLLVVVGLLVGVWIGRRRGLRQLGEAEFRTRWRNVRGIGRWF